MWEKLLKGFFIPIKTTIKFNLNVVDLHKNGQVSKRGEELRVKLSGGAWGFLIMSLSPPSPSCCSLPCKSSVQFLVNWIL